ncbi:Oxaloacetate decarboxylase beta chain [Trichinella pseudospiralis]
MSATRLDPISNQPRTLYDRTCWSEKHCLLVFALVKPCPFAPRTCRCRPVGYLAFNCAVGLGTLIDRLKAKTNVYVRLKLKPLLSQVTVSPIPERQS